jgi:RNA polymerase sigma-70 factor (ECF subfamily)
MKAVKGFDDFRGESTVRTWLHRITTNECLMMRRKKTPGSLDQLSEMNESAYEPEDPSRAPEELAMVSETQTEVLAALDLLPEHYRNTVMLVDGCGMSYDEVARTTQTSVAAVRSTLFRARKALRQQLAGSAGVS